MDNCTSAGSEQVIFLLESWIRSSNCWLLFWKLGNVQSICWFDAPPPFPRKWFSGRRWSGMGRLALGSDINLSVILLCKFLPQWRGYYAQYHPLMHPCDITPMQLDNVHSGMVFYACIFSIDCTFDEVLTQLHRYMATT